MTTAVAPTPTPTIDNRAARRRAVQTARSAFRARLKLPPRLTLSEWADRYRYLSEPAAEKGWWRTDRVPYLREIQDTISGREHQDITIVKSSQTGGPLALDTPIPTPAGWSTMGDLSEGDRVFDEHGRPCLVTYTSPVFTGRQCYELEFSDGSVVTTDAEHRWTVDDDLVSRKGQRRTVTTAEIARTFRGPQRRNRYAIPLCGTLALPEASLPIAPYALGVWLGDGGSASGQITTHRDDADEMATALLASGHTAVVRRPRWVKGNCVIIHIEPHQKRDPSFCRRGHDVRVVGWMEKYKRCAECNRQSALHWKNGTPRDPVRPSTPTFHSRLAALGLINNKHIPVAYLRASAGQRLELLQGLMDTDGTADKRGRSEFVTASARLAYQASELLVSLGLKPRVKAKPSRRGFSGSPARAESTVYSVTFLAYADTPVFQLRRKLARMVTRDGRRTTETLRRRIVAVRSVPSVPVRCIAVDAPSHLYLCGRAMIPTHNTEAINNAVGYYIDQEPSPLLVIQPNVKPMAEEWSKNRLAPMLRDTPQLRGKVRDPRARDSGNTILTKSFPGGSLAVIGANSPAGLASRPIRIVLADELDRWPSSAGSEGDPLSLAEARTITYRHRRKVVKVSTPGNQGESRIEREWAASDQRHFHVPCPHCGEYQPLEWRDSGGKPTITAGSGAFRLVWDKEGSGDQAVHRPETAVYVCRHGCVIEEVHKPGMLAAGRWVKHNPKSDRAGFFISGLLSPWVRWSEIAAKWLRAKDDDEQRKTFFNTILGLLYKLEGEEADPAKLSGRRESYAAEVPAGVGVLTAAVDVQGDRLEVEVRGWGAEEESWQILLERIYGDPEEADVWERLEAIRLREWQHESGARLRIRAMMVDAGYSTDAVYRYVRLRQKAGVYAIKGVDGAKEPMSRAQKANKDGVKAYSINPSKLKDVLFARLRRVVAGPGFLHFGPEEQTRADDAYFLQFGAEKRVVEWKGNRPVVSYRNPSKKRNEAIDLYVYNLAAVRSLGTAVTSRLAAVVAQVQSAGAHTRQRMAEAEARGEGRPLPPSPPPTAAAPRSRGRRMVSKGMW